MFYDETPKNELEKRKKIEIALPRLISSTHDSDYVSTQTYCSRSVFF